MSRAISRAGLLSLAGAATFLVGVLIVEYQASRSEDDTLPPIATRSAPATAARAQSLPDADTQARVDDILARPVFSLTRRPPKGAAAAVSGPVALPRLSAVLVSGHSRTVIFAGSGDGKPVTVGEGGRIGSYVVQSIGVGQATLVGPDGTHVLRPMFAGGGTSVPAAAPAQPSVLDLLRQTTPSVGIPGLGAPR